jgi:hypothetical protein
LVRSCGDPNGQEISKIASPPPPLATSGITDALAALHDLDELPTADHLARFAAVHNSLTMALSSIDEL